MKSISIHSFKDSLFELMNLVNSQFQCKLNCIPEFVNSFWLCLILISI